MTEPLNLRALAIRERALGPDHLDVAKSFHNLAWIYAERQDYTKVELFWRPPIQENSLVRIILRSQPRSTISPCSISKKEITTNRY